MSLAMYVSGTENTTRNCVPKGIFPDVFPPIFVAEFFDDKISYVFN